MRFHHSTRRGRNAKSRHQQSASRSGQAASSAARWAQLSYCRQTNIYFNRRQPVDPPSPCDLVRADSKPRLGPESPFDYGDPAEYQVASARQQQLATIQGQQQPQQPDEPLVDQCQFERLNLLDDKQPVGGQMTVITALGQQPGDCQAHKQQAALLQPDAKQTLGSSTATSDKCDPRAPGTHKWASKKRHRQQGLDSPGQGSPARTMANGSPSIRDKQSPSKMALVANGQPQSPTSAKLNLELARESLVAQVDKHPFWSNKAAKRMHLTHLEERRVFIYELNSFCERRELEWRYEPYRGGLVTGSAPCRRPFQVAPGSQAQPDSPLAASRTADALLGPVSVPFEPARCGPLDSASLKSRSQPATPPSGGPANQRQQSQFQPANYQQHPHHLSSTTSASRLQGLPGSPSETQSADLVSQFEFVGPGTPTRANQLISTNLTTKSPIRRSCSSAASTPVRQPSVEQQAAASSHQQLQASPEAQPMPSAAFVWSIQPDERHRPSPFTGSMYFCEIPDTSFVKRCHGCQGRGRLKCSSCHGVGYEVCISCSGKGTLRALAGPMAGAPGSSGSGSRCASRGAAGDSSLHSSWGAPLGGMWDSAPDSGSSMTLKRRDGEPGGITGAGSTSSGAWLSESCHFCHGAGQKRCWICAGRAYNSCLACAGTGQLRCYLGLNISWLNHRDECVLNNNCTLGAGNSAEMQQQQPLVPRERLKLTSGQVLLEEESSHQWLAPAECPTSHRASQLAPTTGGAAGLAGSRSAALSAPPAPAHGKSSPSPVSAAKGAQPLCSAHEADQLRMASSRLIERHRASYKQEKLIKQRHRVVQVDCSVVSWEWKRRHGHFVIYGAERKVYIAKYPFKSICSIT